jgi:hypothetical protein
MKTKHVASIFRAAEFTTRFQAGFLLALFFDPEDGGDTFLLNVS